MNRPLKILLLEDSGTDAEIIQRLLLKDKMHCEFRLVMDKKGFIKMLDEFSPEVILSDNSMPQFIAAEALKITRQRSLYIPFILVTGTVSEEYAANIIKQGADDYILKDRMTRLPAAIKAALTQRRALKEITDYRYALEQSAIVAITDQKGIIVYANDNFCKISKYAAEELIGQDHRIINSGYHSGSYIRDLWVTIANGKIWRGEFRNKAKDGSFYWVDTTIVPFLNGNGKPYQYLAIRTDITEKKKAEEDLRKSEIRLKEAQTIAHISNWEIDLVQNTHILSDEFYRIFGINRTEVATSAALFLSFIHPDDVDFVQKEVHKAFNSLIDSSFSFRLIRSDGMLRHGYVEWKHEFDSKGNLLRLFGILQDITDRIQSEEELKKSFKEKQALAERMSAIINALPANIALLDANGFIIDINDSWRNFAGANGFIGSNYGVGDNYIDISKTSFGADEDAGKKVARGLNSVLKSRIKEFVFEYTCDSPNEKRWFRMVATPLQGKEYAGAVVMHIDISELRKLEKERLESKMDEQKRITQAMLKGQEIERNAIGVELHDNVNQILVGTKLFLSMVKEDPVSNASLVSSSIDTIQQAIDENRKIAHALVTPDFETKVLAEQIAGLSENMLKTSGIEVSIDNTQLQENLLDGEQKLVAYRIIQEQCTNIIKYAKAHSVTITLSSANDLFKMVISDDGVGMEKNKKTKGIGLRNIKGRLSILNGDTVIKTATGKGFSLEIMIPLKKVDS